MGYYPPAAASGLPTTGGTMTGTITSNKGSALTADAPGLNIVQTWNNAAVTFNGLIVDITNTASSTSSTPINIKVGGASKMSYANTQWNFTGTWSLIGLMATDREAWFGNFSTRVDASGMKISDVGLYRSAAGLWEVNSGTLGTFRDMKARDFFSNNGYLMRSFAAITDGAGASAGTLTNAPAVGNPTKWLKVDDNGTIRYVPAW